MTERGWNDPSDYGEYTVQLPTGRSWRFVQVTRRGETYVDDYMEFSDLALYTYDDYTMHSGIYNGSTNYALGQRTGMIDSSGRTMWTYDERGRKTREQKIVESDGTFVTGWSYNSADMMATMTYPGGNTGQSGEVVTYGYHPQLALNSMTGELDTDDFTYVESTQYDAAGRVQRRALGESDVINQFIYNDWDEHSGRLEQIKGGSASDATELMNLSYSYDLAGNIMSIVDGKMGPQTQSFTYDEMDRLTSAEANGGTQGTYSENYTYNSSTGNLASKGGVSYTYGNSNHKHAVTSLSSGWTYQYDPNGNMTERIVSSSTYTLTYDAYNHLVSVSGASSVDFVYDGDGQRVKVGGTVYIGDYYRYYGSGYNKYYFANGKRIALRFNTGSQANNYYYLSDHLNSSTVLVNADRSYNSREGYKAWGETRYGGVGLHFKFTGEYYVSNIGLYHFGARFYDPALGRFTQADTLVPNPLNTLDWDRYGYVRNNPVKYVDPSGHFVFPAALLPFIPYIVVGTLVLFTAGYVSYVGAGGPEAVGDGLADIGDCVSEMAVERVRSFTKNTGPRTLTDDEKTHVDRATNRIDDFIDEHKKLPEDVDKVKKGEKLKKGEDHVNEAKDIKRMLEKSLRVQRGIPRNKIGKEELKLVDDAIENAERWLEYLRELLKDVE